MVSSRKVRGWAALLATASLVGGIAPAAWAQQAPASGAVEESATPLPRPRESGGLERWPKALRARNARYAVLDRVTDEAGDAHEALEAQAEVARVDDPAGDREEARRALAYQRGHFGTVYAQLARDVDRAGDRVQMALAASTCARRYAALARIRFPRASTEQRVRYGVEFEDEVELAEYKEQYLQFGPGTERVGIASGEGDPAGREYIEQRKDFRADTQGDLQDDRDADLQEARDADRGFDRSETREDDAEEHLDDVQADGLEQDLERAEDALESELDQDLERLDEATDRDVERELEADTERTLQAEEAGLDGGL